MEFLTQYQDTIITVGSIVISVVLGVVAKRYSTKYTNITTFIQHAAAAVSDGKLTKEETEQLIKELQDMVK